MAATTEGTTPMQPHELKAWLGDNHGLNEDELNELLNEANEIKERYPDPDDQAERDAALSVAYRLKTEAAEEVVDDFSRQRVAARIAEAVASAGLRQAAITLVRDGEFSEARFARVASVNRMTIRKWLGKRG